MTASVFVFFLLYKDLIYKQFKAVHFCFRQLEEITLQDIHYKEIKYREVVRIEWRIICGIFTNGNRVHIHLKLRVTNHFLMVTTYVLCLNLNISEQYFVPKMI